MDRPPRFKALPAAKTGPCTGTQLETDHQGKNREPKSKINFATTLFLQPNMLFLDENENMDILESTIYMLPLR